MAGCLCPRALLKETASSPLLPVGTSSSDTSILIFYSKDLFVFVFMCLCTTCIHCPLRSEEGVGSLGTGVIDVTVWVLGLNLVL